MCSNEVKLDYEMELVILKVIWFIIHLFADLIESIYYFGSELRENFLNFIKNIAKERRRSDKEDDILYIEASLSELKKLPKHIAVILNLNRERDVDLSYLVNLIAWSLASGVNFISFYDYKGILKHQLSPSFHRTLKEQLSISDNENIVWGPDFQKDSTPIKFPHRNGYKRHIVVNLYSSEDSYGIFNQLLTDELCKKTNFDDETRKICKSGEITIETIDDALSKLYGCVPEPELALYFGSSTCTTGLLPWHIRLTEFIQVSYKLQHLSLEKFIRVLYKYAKCEQRYGK